MADFWEEIIGMNFANTWIARKRISRAWSAAIMLTYMMMFSLTVMASGGYAEHQGLQVMVKMDKDHYEAGEAITATITVVNTNSQPVTIINLEQLIPEGYVLAENSQVATKNVEVRPGQEIELQVTFVGEPAEPAANGETGTFWDKIFYGETFGIPNIILVVIAVIAIIVFMVLT